MNHLTKNKFPVIGITTFALILLLAFKALDTRPVLYIIGDSTVKNGKGDGSNGQWGWGSILPNYFDTTRLSVQNFALGGTSTRTYLTKGLWKNVLTKMKAGDYLMMQFGHNDGSPLDDTARARGTLPGVGSDHQEIYNPITKQQEIVYTYGWYLRKFVQEAKAKGVKVLICSPIPRNQWKEGKAVRSVDSYAQWAENVAKKEKVSFIPLNELVADYYDEIGEARVNGYFPGDHTHTNLAGAEKNAEIIVEVVRHLPKSDLKKYLK